MFAKQTKHLGKYCMSCPMFWFLCFPLGDDETMTHLNFIMYANLKKIKALTSKTYFSRHIIMRQTLGRLKKFSYFCAKQIPSDSMWSCGAHLVRP